jgi:hypothetical protein
MKEQDNIVRNLIYFFTHNKNLTRQQQARRDKLLARDCMDIKIEGETISTPQESPLPTQRPESEKKTRYISPNNLHSFLYDFNQDNILNKVHCVSSKYNFYQYLLHCVFYHGQFYIKDIDIIRMKYIYRIH